MPGMSPRMKAKKGRFGATGFAPVVTITSPASGFSLPGFVASPAIAGTFTAVATAVDPERGDVSGGIVWSSDLEPNVASPAFSIGADGGSVTITLTVVGTHTLTATSSEGSPVGVDTTDSIQVVVT